MRGLHVPKIFESPCIMRPILVTQVIRDNVIGEQKNLLYSILDSHRFKTMFYSDLKKICFSIIFPKVKEATVIFVQQLFLTFQP